MVEVDRGGSGEDGGRNPQSSYRGKVGFIFPENSRPIVVCEEPTCQSFKGPLECTNPDQLIDDECLGDPRCMTFQPKKDE